MALPQTRQERSVNHCFSALDTLLSFSVVEMWAQDNDSFCLVDKYVGQLPKDYAQQVLSYHSGDRENKTSRSLAKQALKSKVNYFWVAKRDRRVHPEMRFNTAVSIRIPKTETRVNEYFIVAYALKYSEFSESKINFIGLMSHGAVLAKFASSLEVDDTYQQSDDHDGPFLLGIEPTLSSVSFEAPENQKSHLPWQEGAQERRGQALNTVELTLNKLLAAFSTLSGGAGVSPSAAGGTKPREVPREAEAGDGASANSSFQFIPAQKDH